VIASEYRYRQAYIPEDSVALIVSQSGETADTLACLREIKKQGVPTIGIVNAIGSTIAREVDGGTYVHVGPEISVASTKAFTSQAIAMVMFGLTIAQAKGVKPGVLKPYIDEIVKMPDAIKEILDLGDEIKKIAKKYERYEHAIYLGRDVAYPVSMEGALKLKEISYIDANAYAFGELKHGPLALIDDRFVEIALLPKGMLYDKAVSNVQEVLARSGHIVAVTNVDNFDLPVENVIKIPSEIEIFAPILMNVISQLFAYYMTVVKGLNVDQPRNLAKSVTVE
jgi:glucosamine--fructose-6-phosphate aminotransferase (isomerizing)